ncbi:hypothetical protein GGR92_005273 [Spirosoma lacussanchae]|uniref:hypothetical protein n=1 Tax=Spirosoma lacussanchae TaxID=1884249 RepID=UPI0011090696|nr:hypothetical protein [Spirosoma lacussanchae]
MQTKTLQSGHVVKYYNDFEEFPVGRRPYLTRYLSEASELSLTPDQLTQTLGALMQYNLAGDSASVATGLQNLYLSVSAIQEGYEPDALAFGVLLGEADGKPVDDITAEGLKQLLETIKPTYAECHEIVDAVKKNSIFNENRISLALNETEV